MNDSTVGVSSQIRNSNEDSITHTPVNTQSSKKPKTEAALPRVHTFKFMSFVTKSQNLDDFSSVPNSAGSNSQVMPPPVMKSRTNSCIENSGDLENKPQKVVQSCCTTPKPKLFRGTGKIGPKHLERIDLFEERISGDFCEDLEAPTKTGQSIPSTKQILPRINLRKPFRAGSKIKKNKLPNPSAISDASFREASCCLSPDKILSSMADQKGASNPLAISSTGKMLEDKNNLTSDIWAFNLNSSQNITINKSKRFLPKPGKESSDANSQKARLHQSSLSPLDTVLDCERILQEDEEFQTYLDYKKTISKETAPDTYTALQSSNSILPNRRFTIKELGTEQTSTPARRAKIFKQMTLQQNLGHHSEESEEDYI